MLILGLGFLVGIFLGSLVYCLATRSLSKESFWGRSYCPNCRHKLQWYDLLPILSYLSLGGRCRYCRKRISLEYLLTEIVVGALVALLLSQQFTPNVLEVLARARSVSDLGFTYIGPFFVDLSFKIFVICVLAAVFITDIKTGLIPDRITYPSIVIAFLLQLISVIYKIGILALSLYNNPLGKYLLPPHTNYLWTHAWVIAQPLAWSIGAAILVAFFFASLIILTKGRGMGGGDLKLGIFLGLSLGLANAFLALMVAFLFGSIVGIALIMLRRKHFGQTIPFGPFLTIGSLTALFWGDRIINWYINLK